MQIIPVAYTDTVLNLRKNMYYMKLEFVYRTKLWKSLTSITSLKFNVHSDFFLSQYTSFASKSDYDPVNATGLYSFYNVDFLWFLTKSNTSSFSERLYNAKVFQVSLRIKDFILFPIVRIY